MPTSSIMSVDNVQTMCYSLFNRRESRQILFPRPYPNLVLKFQCLCACHYRHYQWILAQWYFPRCIKTYHHNPSYQKKKKNPYLSKNIEKFAINNINRYIEVNGLGEELQSAYRSKHSTETAL